MTDPKKDTPVQVEAGAAEKGKAWYRLEVPAVFEALGSGPKGLSAEEAARRLEKHGPNRLDERAPESLLTLFLHQFKSPLIYILIFAALVSLAIGKVSHAVVIFGVLLVNALMGFIQESRARRSMQALLELSAPRSRVLRGGKACEVPTVELVPGDLVLLESGVRVPADARLVEITRLQVDEAALTGESQPVHKRLEAITRKSVIADHLNMVFAGTVVTSGRAEAVVTATGMETEIGEIARSIQGAPEQLTPIQKKMAGFGRFIIAIVSAQVLLAFLIGFFWRKMDFYDIFLVAVSQMVSSIPEGLPVAVTVALAVGMQRMARRKAYIRKLPAVEVLGSSTVICSDKTGTLTRNEMTSRRAALPGREFEIGGVGYNFEGRLAEGGREVKVGDDPDLALLFRVAALCNNADVSALPSRPGELDVSGDPTEIAYLVAAVKAGLDLEKLRLDYPRTDEIPFEPNLRMMATRHRGGGKAHLTCVKGSPEKVLEYCRAAWKDGAETPLGEEDRKAILGQSDRIAADALRVLAFAFLEEKDASPDELSVNNLKGNLVFLGLVGNIDPPRSEVREAIAQCRAAGIRTVMITGDHLVTALAIARELGICEDCEEGHGGDEIDRAGDDELVEIVAGTTVFGRIEPKHKYRIVRALQARGEVVAMTGDGINDAPALSAADIGVAMGITGTDVAKEASSMVIADDNFATIVHAVEEGRGITGNMRKTIIYLLCSSNTEIIVLLSALFGGFALPLLPLMILWVNLVTDGAMTVPLVMEPREEVMNRPPEQKDQAIVTPWMLKLLAWKIPVMVGAVLGLYYLARTGRLDPAFSGEEGLDYARTVAFTGLVVTQWFNGLSTRSIDRSVFRREFFNNRFVVFGLGAGTLVQLAVIYLPFLQRFFQTVPLSGGDWLRIVLFSSVILWAEEARKAVQRALRKRAPGGKGAR